MNGYDPVGSLEVWVWVKFVNSRKKVICNGWYVYDRKCQTNTELLSRCVQEEAKIYEDFLNEDNTEEKLINNLGKKIERKKERKYIFSLFIFLVRLILGFLVDRVKELVDGWKNVCR